MFFFFNDTATTEIYTLSLHDALPICALKGTLGDALFAVLCGCGHNIRKILAHLRALLAALLTSLVQRSEEHTSELQSRQYLVCRLLLEKKKKILTILFFSYAHS